MNKNEGRVNKDMNGNDNNHQKVLGKCFNCGKIGHTKTSIQNVSHEEKQSQEKEEENAELVLYAISENESSGKDKEKKYMRFVEYVDIQMFKMISMEKLFLDLKKEMVIFLNENCSRGSCDTFLEMVPKTNLIESGSAEFQEYFSTIKHSSKISYFMEMMSAIKKDQKLVSTHTKMFGDFETLEQSQVPMDISRIEGLILV